MIIIKFCGALGNQLFQYALYEKMRILGKDVKADISAFGDGNEKRFFYLDELGIEFNIASADEIAEYLNRKTIRFVPGFLQHRHYYFEKKPYVYNKKILSYDDCYLEGYWQNYRYFDDIKDELLKHMKFPCLPLEQKKLAEKMENENSVAVHVRMGDYLNLQDLYGGICDADYYDRAFSYIEGNISNPVYYGFSDDVDKASALLAKHKINWIDYNSEKGAIYDLILMSKCKNNIIANSSFSWWGAYLEYNNGKVVVSPNRWMNCFENSNIAYWGWISL
ncbi:alpha-1,2-fucosyltransferase [Butyrivibrio proteoclasticus]|nr:alpha-1,2-fucosyltransferase [Butyrivibrio proteoclasticus]